MAELVTIARPYAEAVFRLAREQNALVAWADALALIDAVVRDPQVNVLLDAPTVTAGQLEDLITGAVGKYLSVEARNLVQLLIQNRRLGVIAEIRAGFEALKREQEGGMEATIVSALKLDDGQVGTIVSALEKKYGRKIMAKVELDSQLIGGVKIVAGDKVIDATVRGRLDAMAAALAQ